MRDMLESKFLRAVAHNGFSAVDDAFVHDTTGHRIDAAVVMTPAGPRIDRRATLDLLVAWKHRNAMNGGHGAIPHHAGTTHTNEEAPAAGTARASN